MINIEPEVLKQIIFCVAIIVGQILTVYIPYRNKRIADGRKFDRNYAYTAFLGYVIMATMTLQSEAIMSMPLEFTSVMMLIFGSGALQKTVIAQITPKQLPRQ